MLSEATLSPGCSQSMTVHGRGTRIGPFLPQMGFVPPVTFAQRLYAGLAEAVGSVLCPSFLPSLSPFAGASLHACFPFILRIESPNKPLEHLIPSWLLLLGGPGLAWQPSLRHLYRCLATWGSDTRGGSLSKVRFTFGDLSSHCEKPRVRGV